MRRRRFIRLGLFSAAGLTLAGGGLLALRRGPRPFGEQADLKVLDQRTFDIVAMVAERVVPATAEVKVNHEALARRVDDALSFASPLAQRDFPRLLALFDNALTGLLTRGSTAPLTALTPAAQTRALDQWRDSSVGVLRGGYQAMRKLVLGAYYADLAAARTTGYPGPPFNKARAADISPRQPLSPPFLSTRPGARP